MNVVCALRSCVALLELPVCSPLVSSVHKILEQWETDLKDRLEKFDSAPASYIPGVYIEPSFGSSVTIVKYHTIMDPANTPFTCVLNDRLSSRSVCRCCCLSICPSVCFTLAISTPSTVGHDICRHSYAVERGLLVVFCAQPHYYLTARFPSPSLYMVSDEPFPHRSRPMSC